MTKNFSDSDSDPMNMDARGPDDKKDLSILFLGKENDEKVKEALEFCQGNFQKVTAYLGKWGDPLPDAVQGWQGDYIISYLSRWILPVNILEKAHIAAINFHPAPPEYPGFGCINFALNDEAEVYGVTCHYMSGCVDAGNIIAAHRFSVLSSDTVSTLLSRTYEYQLQLFYRIAVYIHNGEKPPISNEKWKRRPFTRKEFNQLNQISFDMSKEEVARRIRATTFGAWRPIVNLHGFIFELKID